MCHTILLLYATAQAGFERLKTQNPLKPALTVPPTRFLITRCIRKDDMGKDKGLVLRSVDLCGLFRREDTSAHAAKHSLALLLIWVCHGVTPFHWPSGQQVSESRWENATLLSTIPKKKFPFGKRTNSSFQATHSGTRSNVRRHCSRAPRTRASSCGWSIRTSGGASSRVCGAKP